MHAHPAAAKPCATCGDLAGRGYPACPGCARTVDRPWESAWALLPDPDPEVVADAPRGDYPWACVDWALRQLPCAGCGGELAAGAPDCVGCAAADAARWELAPPTPHERVLRTAVVVLRAPTWRRRAVASTWRLLLPFVVAGCVPSSTTLSEVRTQVVAGRYDELAELEALPLALPLLPWRRSTA
ncbi:hypothetical protein [Actinophytocola glycyrrhizae]|uniref:Amidophosphoribosyltransferase n=1 Tax=Actinophytocola glycyrrhizae TaxID=2044873 RepID=A0ABV9S1J1_9PSEU